jgi:tetratricopeptide (TPR) repeat protein
MCYSCLVFGQVESDTLWSVWKNEKRPTVERLDALEKFCKQQYLYTKPDSAYALAKIAYEFAEREDLKKEMSMALKIMGIASSNLSKYEEAIDLQNRGIEISKSIDYKYGIVKHLNSLGNVYLRMSNYVAALNAYSRGLEIAQKEKDKKLVASLQNNIALVYFDLKDYDKALELLTEVLSMQKNLGNYKGEANALTNIGTIYRQQENYTEALKYYEQSLKLKLDNDISHGLPICYSNIGQIHYKQNNNQKALKYYNLSINLQRTAGDQKGIARSLINFGAIYQNTNSNTSISLLNQAIEIAKKTKNTEELRDAIELLYQVYQSKKQYKQALEMHELFHKIQDSMHNVQNQKAIFNYESKVKYEKELLEKKLEYEQELSKTQLRNQRNQFLIITSLVLLAFLIGVYLKKRYQDILRKREALLNKVEKLNKKLAKQTVSTAGNSKDLSLNKNKIETAIGNRIGESSWIILNLIHENPSISNKEIAEKVSLSVEGVSSSLRRMYTAFGVKSKGNKKVTLLMKAVNISVQD